MQKHKITLMPKQTNMSTTWAQGVPHNPAHAAANTKQTTVSNKCAPPFIINYTLDKPHIQLDGDFHQVI